jgi:hypothetical protein
MFETLNLVLYDVRNAKCYTDTFKTYFNKLKGYSPQLSLLIVYKYYKT